MLKDNYIYKNADRIAIIMLGLMMAMQVSLFKIFAKIIPIFNYSYNPPALCAIYLLMTVIIFALVVGPRVLGVDASTRRSFLLRYRYLIIMLLVLLAAIISEDLITIVKGQLRITNIMTHNLDYLYTFLALPIAILMVENKWRFEQMADTMMAISVASLFMRTFVSIYGTMTGIEIKIISQESALEFWIRDNRLRIVPACFICLLAPMAIYLIQETSNRYKKIWYCFVIAVVAAYTLVIWQSRAGIMFIFGGCAIMFLFGIMSRKSLYIRWSLVALAGVAFIALGGVSKLLNAFATTDTTQFVGENKGHYRAYALFWERFLRAPWGEGLTETLAEWFPNGRALWMCDAGIMYSIVPMGVLIIIFFIMMFGRGIYVYCRGCRTNQMAVLSLSLTFIVLASEAAMDCFFTPLAFMTPFYIAIMEYIGQAKDDKV